MSIWLPSTIAQIKGASFPQSSQTAMASLGVVEYKKVVQVSEGFKIKHYFKIVAFAFKEGDACSQYG